MPSARSMGRLIGRILLALFALALLLVGLALWQVHRSVPVLDGGARMPGLQAAVTISRDALGTAVVRGANRLDVARGLGFVHAQERFFEMDLARRSAAGELSELFGPIALERDKTRRLHRLRAMLTARYAAMDASDHALLQAYADGVNAGLAHLAAKPWQYLLLRADARPWQPVDSLLVIGEMFWMLQGSSVEEALDRAQWRACAPPRIGEWLEPRGGQWDGALDLSVSTRPAVPGPDELDLRKSSPEHAAAASQAQARAHVLPDVAADDRHEPMTGSNSWAVDGAHTTSGDAMVANDMHLGLNAPSTWFRAQFEIGDGASALRAEGVTLPGVPALVVGSNGHVAWGFTNSYGVWFEWVAVPLDAAADRLGHLTETIAVKGADSVVLPITLFDGLPVAARQGASSYAVNWVADQGDAYNLKLDDLLGASSVEEATGIAAQSGIPQQNFIVADSHGAIAWTIAGVRFDAGPDASPSEPTASIGSRRRLAIPASASSYRRGAPAPAPIVQRPRRGLLWTANARTYAFSNPKQGEQFPDGVLPGGRVDIGEAIGDGGFDLGARAQQIRDRLAATPKFDERTLGAIHFDDEALFLRPWAGRIAAVAASAAARPDVTALLKDWNGRADADQAGYRLVGEVRKRVLDALWAAWTAPLIQAGDCRVRKVDWHARFEYAAEDALDQQPPHLLPRGFANWDAFLLAQVDAAVADMTRHGARPLAQATWGEVNRSRIGHPPTPRARPRTASTTTASRCARTSRRCRTSSAPRPASAVFRSRSSSSRHCWCCSAAPASCACTSASRASARAWRRTGASRPRRRRRKPSESTTPTRRPFCD